MFTITIFENLFSKDPTQKLYLETIEEFEKFFLTCSKKNFYLKKFEGKKKTNAFLISPAKAKNNATDRTKSSADGWSRWCALDIDDLKNYTRKSFLQLVDSLGYYYICYSTPSSLKTNTKLRLVFVFDREISVAETSKLWFALYKMLDEVIDNATKDIFRLLYCPGTFYNAYNFIIRKKGDYICVDDLFLKYPYFISDTFEIPLELESNYNDFLQDRLSKKHKNYNNENFYYTGLHDCPFVSQKIISEYSSLSNTDGSGRYEKMYKFILSVAFTAIRKGYTNITASEILKLIKELDISYFSRHNTNVVYGQIKKGLNYAISRS